MLLDQVEDLRSGIAIGHQTRSEARVQVSRGKFKVRERYGNGVEIRPGSVYNLPTVRRVLKVK
jgi:hypothetical protein